MPEPIRLAKRIAEIAACSRREAERYIEDGWVTVDGVVVREPQHRVMLQTVELRAGAAVAPVELVTILYHLAAGMTSERGIDPPPAFSIDNRAADDASGIHPQKRHFSRLTATLPLQPNAGGLTVFTQDWRVTRKLVEDAATVEQEYVVEVVPADGAVADAHALKRLNHGLSFNGRVLPPAKVSWQNETRLRFAVKGPQPGQLAQVCASVGFKVLAMKRIRIGKISMGKMPAQQWRYLPPNERF